MRRLSFCVSFIILCFIGSINSNTIYLHYFGYSDAEIFNLQGSWNRDGAGLSTWKLREYLKQRGYRLTTFRSVQDIGSDAVYVVFFNVACSESFIKQVYQKVGIHKMAAFLWEPPVKSNYLNYSMPIHRYFSKIFTWDQDLIDGKKYLQCYYPQPTLEIGHNILPFHEKKLCVLIARNQQLSHPKELCSERLSILKFFANKAHEFDLYGKGWSRALSTYRGAIGSKIELLKRYKFCIAYENTKDVFGYVTEKIFDCFVAGCVPIYYGASDIERYVPKTCFIDRRDFASNQVLYDYMKNMDEVTYSAYQESIRDYLASEQAHCFSIDFFITTFVQGLGLKG